MGKFKKHSTRLLLIAIAASVAAGCIPSERQLLMEREIREMKGRLSTLERGIETLREGRIDETSQRLETLARQQADQQAALDGLRVEFQGIVGRFDDAASDRDQIRQDIILLREDLDLRLAALENRTADTSREELTPPEAQQSPPTEPTPEEFYQQGLSLIREQKDFTAGREILLKFIDQFPTSDLRPNAIYWIGEAFYAEKDFENAIPQFQKVIETYPKHPKAPASLLKQGFSFQGMGDIDSARSIFKRLIEQYPESEEAQKASPLLQEKEH